MKNLPKVIFRLILLISILLSAIYSGQYLSKYLQTQAFATPMINPVVEEGKVWETSTAPAQTSPRETKQTNINLLLLGLDGRLGDKKPRCDAIHMLSIDKKNQELTITSIPRGTVLDLEIDGLLSKTYISNACHLIGITKTIKEIEKIAGLKADYVVKVGFSQSLGIFKTLDLPAADTLQYLRNRAYGIGDYQRSHNQALFIKDLLLTRFEEFERLPNIVKYLGFQMIDTNLDYEKALGIIRDFPFEKLKDHPEKIKLISKPGNKYKPQDIHFLQNSRNQSFSSDQEYDDFQKQLEGSLNTLISRADDSIKQNKTAGAYTLISVPFYQQIWRQIDDKAKSNNYYYQLLRLYIFSTPVAYDQQSLILDYISEMESQNQGKLVQMGKQLLETQEN